MKDERDRMERETDRQTERKRQRNTSMNISNRDRKTERKNRHIGEKCRFRDTDLKAHGSLKKR